MIRISAIIVGSKCAACDEPNNHVIELGTNTTIYICRDCGAKLGKTLVDECGDPDDELLGAWPPGR